MFLVNPYTQHDTHFEFVGSYTSSHTGTGTETISIGLGEPGASRQTIVVLHGRNPASIEGGSTVTLGGLQAALHFEGHATNYSAESNNGVIVFEFDTSSLTGTSADLVITPVATALGFVVGVYSCNNYHTGHAQPKGAQDANTLDLPTVLDGDVVVAAMTIDTGTVDWTVGVTEVYDADSGSTIQGSGAINLTPTAGSDYTITNTDSGSSTEAMRALPYRPKKLKDDRLMCLLRPTGVHSSTTMEDASWLEYDLAITASPFNEYTGRYYSGGQGAIDFDGSTQWITVSPDCTPAWYRDTGWTIEWWEYPHATGGNRFGTRGTNSMYGGFSNDTFYCSSNGSSWDISNARSLGTVTLNTWRHRAIVWTGTTWYIWEDGTQIDTWSNSLSMHHAGNTTMEIGSANSNHEFNGLIEDMAVWRYPKYTSAFTPSTTPIAP